MKGLELSELFYREYGAPMIHEKFAAYEGRIAVGLCGHGSECLGYDDEVSPDHDYCAAFCLWLTDEDNRQIGFALERAYSALPKVFRGVSMRTESVAGGAKGVMTVSEFYRRYTGSDGAPQNNLQWLYTPSFCLCEATNGKVFRDDLGVFSDIREKLLHGMPEDVRLKKIAACLSLMAQSGQYNYARCQRHGERAAAALALDVFVKNALSVIFLLNRRHKPYYKWSFRALRELDRLSELADPLEYLLCSDDSPQNIEIKRAMIEQVSEKIAAVLKNDGLCVDCGDYLEPYAYAVMRKIKDPELRNMHVMDGADE